MWASSVLWRSIGRKEPAVTQKLSVPWCGFCPRSLETRKLNSNYENLAAPWDSLLFSDHLPSPSSLLICILKSHRFPIPWWGIMHLDHPSKCHLYQTLSAEKHRGEGRSGNNFLRKDQYLHRTRATQIVSPRRLSEFLMPVSKRKTAKRNKHIRASKSNEIKAKQVRAGISHVLMFANLLASKRKHLEKIQSLSQPTTVELEHCSRLAHDRIQSDIWFSKLRC